MIKKLIIGAIIIGIIAVGVIFLIPWGNYESNLVKSDLEETELKVDSSGQIIPTLDDLEGLYFVNSTIEGNIAELIFEIETNNKIRTESPIPCITDISLFSVC